MDKCKHGNTGHCDYCLARTISTKLEVCDHPFCRTCYGSGRIKLHGNDIGLCEACSGQGIVGHEGNVKGLKHIIDCIPKSTLEMLDRELDRRGLK